MHKAIERSAEEQCHFLIRKMISLKATEREFKLFYIPNIGNTIEDGLNTKVC